jgi:hypothetical protein
MVLDDEYWAIVYTQRDARMCDEFIATLRKASGRMEISIKEPTYIELSGNRRDDYKNGLEDKLDP